MTSTTTTSQKPEMEADHPVVSLASPGPQNARSSDVRSESKPSTPTLVLVSTPDHFKKTEVANTKPSDAVSKSKPLTPVSDPKQLRDTKEACDVPSATKPPPSPIISASQEPVLPSSSALQTVQFKLISPPLTPPVAPRMLQIIPRPLTLFESPSAPARSVPLLAMSPVMRKIVSNPIQTNYHKSPLALKPNKVEKKGPRILRWKHLTPLARSDSVVPSARHGHRAITLNDNKHVVVIGGGNEGLYVGVNILDVEKMEWFQPKTRGDPPLVASFGAAYDNCSSDESRHRILVFGGMEELCTYSNSLYELKYNKDEDAWDWRRLNPLPTRDPNRPYPVPRLGHSFTIIKDRVYLFGGLANLASFCPQLKNDEFFPQYLNDLFILNTRVNYPHGTWDAPVTFGIPPSPRESHSALAYSKNAVFNKIIFFGGMNGRRLDDLFVLDVDTMFWSRTVPYMPYTPIGRSLHSVSLVGRKMYVFAGWAESPQDDELNKKVFLSGRDFMCVNSVGCLDVETMTWEMVKPIGTEPHGLLPPPRAGHCSFTIDGRIYIWSGRDGFAKSRGRQVCHNDMWRLDVEPPIAPGKCKLIRSMPNSLTLAWDPVPGADSYILQCFVID